MFSLSETMFTQILCGNYPTANEQCEELLALVDKTSSAMWNARGRMNKSYILALTGGLADAAPMIIAGITLWRSTGASLSTPLASSYLAATYAELGQFDASRRWIDEAFATIEATKEKWCEAEVHRVAGEIALRSREPDAIGAEASFERALAIARGQQAKSWELRAAMSVARLWRDQGKRNEARDLLVPIYGWFTEGFDTRDLKEAKALLDALES